jgi:hypothetical protein
VNEPELERVIQLLEEIRDNQKAQLEAVLVQSERAARIQDRAEQLQAKSEQIMTRSRRVLAIALPVIVVLIAYVSWVLFRYALR